METERLIIKNIETEEELSALLTMYNKADNMRYIQSGKCSWTRKELEDRYGLSDSAIKITDYGFFVVKLKEGNRIIGEAGIFDSFHSESKVEIGYIIDSAYWNKGYGTEVCLALINYIQMKLKQCEEIIARMYEDNTGSIRVCEKAGFRLYEKGKTAEERLFREYRLSVSDR